ncbi:hypothetical protein [Kluyvera chengduensis]|uniref:hypothetical protein n=1 Tax=Kluyvera sp. 142359 TaxID=3375726 RepID=UPI0037754D7C
MMESVLEKIDRFNQYNKTMIEVALAESNRSYQGTPGKLLLCAIFDSLSKVAFPDIGKNNERFKKTIVEYSGWSECNRVSLLQLRYAFEHIGEVPEEFLGLKEWVLSELLAKLPKPNSLINKPEYLSIDPEMHMVLSLWPHQEGKPVKLNRQYAPDEFTHLHLLWKYRNKLAHELRVPGTSSEFPTESSRIPYYVNLNQVNDKGLLINGKWLLIYPIDFFAEITDKAIDTLCSYYRTKNTSPFLHYTEGAFWLKR